MLLSWTAEEEKREKRKLKREKRNKRPEFLIRSVESLHRVPAGKEPRALARAIRRMRSSHLFVAVVIAGQIGCAPAKLLDPPAGWPVEWKNRKLYNTPNVYIYARNDAAAGQADALAERVIREFSRRTAGRSVKGLLLVTDLDEEPVVPDHKTYCNLMLSKAAAERGQTLSAEELEERYGKIRQAMAEQGTDAEMELLMTPISLDRSDLSGTLGLERTVSESVDWAAAISTEALIVEANRKNMQGELKNREIGLVLQMPLAPIIMFEERLRNAKAFVARDVTLFRNLANQQQDWSEEKRQDETQAYMERKLNEALLPVITQLVDVLQAVVEPLKPLLPSSADSESEPQDSQRQD